MKATMKMYFLAVIPFFALVNVPVHVDSQRILLTPFVNFMTSFVPWDLYVYRFAQRLEVKILNSIFLFFPFLMQNNKWTSPSIIVKYGEIRGYQIVFRYIIEDYLELQHFIGSGSGNVLPAVRYNVDLRMKATMKMYFLAVIPFLALVNVPRPTENVFFVAWDGNVIGNDEKETGRFRWYGQAAANTELVGRIVGNFMKELQDKYTGTYADIAKMHCIVWELKLVDMLDDGFNVLIASVWELKLVDMLDDGYGQAAANTELVGRIVGNFMKELQDKYTGTYADIAKMHCIGFSLGAQACGHVGRWVQRTYRLDPADPLYADTVLGSYPTDVHLDKDDATFVDGYHTSGANSVFKGAGDYEPIGHVDFYPNGGVTQPGCPDDWFRALVDYTLGTLFGTADRCSSWEAYQAGACFVNYCTQDSESCSEMGIYAADYPKASGLFYIKTYPHVKDVKEGFCGGTGSSASWSIDGRAPVGRQAPVGLTASQGSPWPCQSPVHQTAVRMILVTPLFGCPNNRVTKPQFGGLGICEAKNCPGWRLDRLALDDRQVRDHELTNRRLTGHDGSHKSPFWTP
ncbi:unnamed protein product [Notodromas monacha]|uniref:Lipase domain-containing protein n=1 Tax=Notodromas monacha TaxID=399045 RepID=A0A7R9GIQ0_9CRUS|nr:unnamed protein product [Notodromas monacha]CAG0922024.1 unnamed protein product [Notodromas monacha]